MAPECHNTLKRKGCIKVHWECWSECNLGCPFCYRTMGAPLTTEQALLLLRVVHTAGVRSIVFAGGDPSIRGDIGQLVSAARELEMRVEIQTNAHHVRPEFLTILRTVDMVGLSLDGEDAETHDQMRQKPGNFQRVVDLLASLNEAEVPVIVRTVVTNVNFARIRGLGDVLTQFQNLRRWSLMQFTPAGMGALHRATYSIDRASFDSTVSAIKSSFQRQDLVHAYPIEDKPGVYCLVTPDGKVFGTTPTTNGGLYPVAGNALTDHISGWAERLPFDAERHWRRYGADAVRSRPSRAPT